MMRRIIFLIMIMVASVSYAQKLKLTITQKNGKAAAAAAQGVNVYSFLTKPTAQKLCDKLNDVNNMPEIKAREGDMDRGKTSKTGYVELDSDEGGYLVVDATKYIWPGGILVSLSSLKLKKDENGDFIGEYVIIRENKDGELGGVTTMNEHTTEAKSKLKRSSTMKAIRSGKKMRFSGVAIVDSAYARIDARYVQDFKLVLPDEDNVMIARFAPIVLDGEEYDKVMQRRMGYDWTHDKLAPYAYVDEDSIKHFMQSGKGDALPFSREIYPFDSKKYYNCVGHEWYEDFNNVYHQDANIIWPGTWTDHNRFINWENAKMDLQVDTVRYRYESREVSEPISDGFHLEFEVGKADLKMDDSLTVVEYNRLMDLIDGFYYSNNETSITPQVIKGLASPEGNEKTNRELSARRARNITNILLSRYSDRSKFKAPKVEFDIVPWSEVVDSLMARGDEYSMDCADRLRAIIAANKSLDAQYNAIKKESWYIDYVYPQIIPHLRRVEFTYKAISRKLLSPDEIFERYQEVKKNPGKKMNWLDYEYYHILRHLSDDQNWPELLKFAEEAYHFAGLKEDVIRDDIDKEKYGTSDFSEVQEVLRKQGVDLDTVTFEIKKTDEYKRAYPLAAYYISQAKLKMNIVDTNILKEYFDWSNRGWENLKRSYDGDERGWWNDKAFVVQQSMMYCADDDFTMATQVLDEHLPDDPKYRRFRVFLRCLDGQYTEPDVIDTVANSSPMNAAAIYIAQEETGYYMKAMQILSGDLRLDAWSDDMEIDTTDARVYYMRAICNFKTKNKQQGEESPLLGSTIAYDEDHLEDYASPIFTAFKKDESLHTFFQRDGNFNSAYRVLVNYFWKRMKDGVDMPQIAKEYEALRTKYNMIKK